MEYLYTILSCSVGHRWNITLSLPLSPSWTREDEIENRSVPVEARNVVIAAIYAVNSNLEDSVPFLFITKLMVWCRKRSEEADDLESCFYSSSENGEDSWCTWAFIKNVFLGFILPWTFVLVFIEGGMFEMNLYYLCIGVKTVKYFPSTDFSCLKVRHMSFIYNDAGDG